MLQTRFVGRLDVSVPEYLDMVERKTAALFACCCQTAGILAGIDPNHRRALSGYGRNLGMAFQLIDDLLDFTGDERRLGKPSGSDLREGKATLAVLDAVAAGDGEVRRLATAVMDAAAIDDGPLVALRERLLASGAFARVQTLAQRYAQDAVRALDGFDGGAAATALRTLPEILVYRDQ
jgi:octaprenyl-diphosphate synthase